MKTAWRLFDGALVESVLMRYPQRVTVCVSSQAGCGMGCPFCATGQAGLTRNLSTGEIVEQVVAAARAARDMPGGPVGCTTWCSWGWASHWPTTPGCCARLRRITDPAPDGLGLSARGVTVSTVGLVPAMDTAGRRATAGHAGAVPARA